MVGEDQALVARVAGGGEREVGAGREIDLDASGSRDPDIDSDIPQAWIYICCAHASPLSSLCLLPPLVLDLLSYLRNLHYPKLQTPTDLSQLSQYYDHHLT